MTQLLLMRQRDRLVKDLGNKKAMILHNHGLLTAGSTIAEAFVLMFYLERSCETQITAQSSGTQRTIPPPSVCEHSALQQERNDFGQMEWTALIRMLDREDPSYRD